MNPFKDEFKKLSALQNITDSWWRMEVRHNHDTGYQTMFYCEDTDSSFYGLEIHNDKDYERLMETHP